MSDNNSQPIEDEPIDTLDDEIEVDDDASELDDEVEVDPDSLELDDAVVPTPETQTADELDIDAALAAVSQLSLLADKADDKLSFDEDLDSDIDETDDEIDEGDYRPIDEESELAESTPYTDFELPQSLTMTRGQLSSVIPAFALIAVGGWLTFTLTTSSIPPSNGLLIAIVLLGVGAVFLAQWLNSGRWSRGNFFIGMATLLIGGVQLYLSQMLPMNMSSGWSLWIVAVGIALFGAGFITLPRLPRLSIMGALIIVAGAIGYALTSGAIEPEIITFVSNLWFIGVAIIIFMIIAPLVRRRS